MRGGVSAVPPPDDAVEVLGGIELLAAAAPGELAAIAAGVDWLRCDAGIELFAQGDPGGAMYLVVRGRLECLVDDRLVSEVGRGGTLGELALLADAPRAATVRTVRDSLLVRLPAERLTELATAQPNVSLALARLAAARSTRGPVAAWGRPVPRSIGIVALDGSPAAAALVRSLPAPVASLVPARWIGFDDVTAWHDAQGVDAVAERLAEAEDRSDVVVVTIPWTHSTAGGAAERALVATVLRQMDLVVGVTAASSTPDPRVLDHLATAGRPASLVLVHPRGARPLRTAAAVDEVARCVQLRAHVHVQSGHPADPHRLARLLLGRSVGVVLGGGGSRGFAHIGVLRALAEAGVPVDHVAGSSMGAVMGAQVAAGWSPGEMLERNRDAWSRRRLFDVGLPTLSLLRGRRAVAVLDELFGDVQIEDLWLDFACTTVDLSVYRQHVARRGRVADWVAASAAVPGLWPPYVDADGHLHADGGLLDNVPTDVMRAGEAGIVIGIDVCHRQSEMRLARRTVLPAGFGLVLARRRGQWFPSIVDVLNRSNMLASLQQHRESERYADLYLTPPVEDQGFAAFDRVEHIAEIGYRSTVEALAAVDLATLLGR